MLLLSNIFILQAMSIIEFEYLSISPNIKYQMKSLKISGSKLVD